jgi:ribosomal protein L14E/L6E/L27E
MVAIEVGRVCVVKRGSMAGKMVTVVEVVGDFTVRVKDERGKEKVMNVRHLEPMSTKV